MTEDYGGYTLDELLQEVPPGKREIILNEMHLDSLMKIPNRAKFDKVYANLVSRVKRPGEDVTVSAIMGDVDNFKKINDTYGHKSGDRVLHTVAQTLQNTLREHEKDNIYRYGGEEILFLIFDSNLIQGFRTANRLRKKVEEECKFYEARDGELYHIQNGKYKDDSGAEHDIQNEENIVGVTMCFGVSHYSNISDNVETFINQADKALYIAKNVNELKNKTRVWVGKYETQSTSS